jgi:predicted dehydrogenase
MKAALIGRGRWGKIIESYIRNNFDLVSISGKESNINELSKNVDVFFVCTPIDTHYEMTKKCLEQGKHVFVEKPLTTKTKQALELKMIAEKNKCVLFTDYVEMYAPSRLKMVELFPKIGEIISVSAYTKKYDERITNSILWNLHCHHLSMLSLFINLDDLKYYYIHPNILFTGKFDGHIAGNNLSEYPEKRFIIWGENGKLEYNYYSDNTLKLTEYHKFYSKKYFKFDEKNNLDFSIKEFKECIDKGKKSNIDISIQITNIIENLLR